MTAEYIGEYHTVERSRRGRRLTTVLVVADFVAHTLATQLPTLVWFDSPAASVGFASISDQFDYLDRCAFTGEHLVVGAGLLVTHDLSCS